MHDSPKWPYFGCTMDQAREKEKDFCFPDRTNPWLARFRPRGSQNPDKSAADNFLPFRNTPYAPPKQFGWKV
jgi:hypothetical protein